MAKVPANLREVDSRRVGGCQKPTCKASGILHRHHLRHEAMWFGIWSGRRRNEILWADFVKRYYQFKVEDTVILCADHHAEIHRLYDAIIEAERKIVNRRLSLYTWRQADVLMNKLKLACQEWIKNPTPGINSKTFGLTRRRNQSYESKGRSPKQS